MTNGVFTPAPGRAPAGRMLARHARFELLLTLRRGESLVLSLAIPLVAMLAAGLTDVIRLPTEDRLGYVVPGAIALAVMSTAFTGQAITVGYERFYGVLKRLGASPLTRSGLLLSKTAAIGVLVVVQATALGLVGVLIGWRPHPDRLVAVVAVTLLATAVYGGLALVLASLLRPETTTAVATLVYVIALAVGGVMFPRPAAGNVELLVPLAAHAEALRATLSNDHAIPSWVWFSLGAWAVVSVYAAARTFRWQ